MTKAKISRLIFLESLHGLNGEEIGELLALQAEFEAWEPEQEVNRWKQEFKSYAVHDDARCEYFKKCQCGLDELLKEADTVQKEGPS